MTSRYTNNWTSESWTQMAFHSVYKEYLIEHFPGVTQSGQSSDHIYVRVRGHPPPDRCTLAEERE